MRIKQRRTVSKQIPSYKFLLDETYKICTNIVGYDKSNVLIAKLSDEELNTPLDFSSDEKKKEDAKQVKADDAKICYLCGELIVGDYEYVRTKRRTEMYFHKGMKCRKGK